MIVIHIYARNTIRGFRLAWLLLNVRDSLRMLWIKDRHPITTRIIHLFEQNPCCTGRLLHVTVHIRLQIVAEKITRAEGPKVLAFEWERVV